MSALGSSVAAIIAGRRGWRLQSYTTGARDDGTEGGIVVGCADEDSAVATGSVAVGWLSKDFCGD